MSETVPTVGSALALDRAAAERLIDAAAPEEAGGLSRQAVAAVLRDVWSEVAGRVAEALDVPLPDVLAGAWSRAHELAQYRDPERYPPDQVNTVPLAAHTVVSSHRPHVELEIRGLGAAAIHLRLELEVELSARVNGARLAIRAGRIERLLAGTVDLVARLGCRGVAVAERDLSFTLPGAVSFGQGIPLSPAIPLGSEIPIAAAPADAQPVE